MDEKLLSIQSALQPADLRQTKLRYIILLLCTAVIFGNLFVYDNPVALQTPLMDKLNIDLFRFNLFYSIYSFPNIILPLIGGFLVDKFGARRCLVVYSAIICTGQAIFALGVREESYWIALLGRGVYGIGAESQNGDVNIVTQGGILSKWFYGKEIALALSLNISTGNLADSLNMWLEPRLEEETGSVMLGLWIGVIICMFSLACVFVLNFIDIRREKRLVLFNSIPENSSEAIKLSDIKDFNRGYWILILSIFTTYSSIFPFYQISTGYYQSRFHFSSTESGTIIVNIIQGSCLLISPILSPILGYIVDRLGKRIYLIITASCIVTLVHLSFLLMPECDKCGISVIPMVFLMIGYSIYSAVIWSSITYTVDEKKLMTGFGIGTSAMNVGLSITPLVVGSIYDTSGYIWVSLLLIIFGSLSIFTGILLLRTDYKLGLALNSIKYSSDTESKDTTPPTHNNNLTLN